jgi:hypothetical protein
VPVCLVNWYGGNGRSSSFDVWDFLSLGRTTTDSSLFRLLLRLSLVMKETICGQWSESTCFVE